MSNWTHVNGVFRIDCIRSLEDEPDFTKIFGKQCLYHESGELWDEKEKHPELFLPSGSEGTCMISVWDNPNKDYTDAFTVSIFGDLRDHDSTEEIMDYFKAVCEKLDNFHIRQAVMTAENEWFGTQTATYVDGVVHISTYK